MRRVRFFSLLMATLLALGMLVATPASADESGPIADPMVAAPKAGQCYLTVKKQLLATALEQEAISCKQKHTLWVLGAIPLSPAQLATASAELTLPKGIRRKCLTMLTKALGKPRLQALSAYQAALYLPSQAQQEAGARWVSCTVGVVSKYPRLQVSKARKPIKLSRSVPTKVRGCLTAKAYTNCAASHGWRSVHAEPVRWRRSETKMVKLAQRLCGPYVRSAKFRYVAYTAGAKSTTFLVCFTKSRR